ncbi:polyketide-8 synthase acyl carrier protein [Streptomyces hygroscopicus]|uniref:acyl carrier protein n=1 Tax=Streptomyces hygroscopicus TaxID=1912 RepID=UPI00223FF5C6|nr:acyl carrier protein [Streptomyces hygroscopicus]MCW7944036.1 polyketide-8 synthase acyl carrier protein [Streptomyces hygroscopicus]
MVSTTTDERYAKVREIICDVLEIEEDEIEPEALFVENYGADSLQAIEILSSLEKSFGIVIDQSELARMVNLEAVNDVVTEAFEKK